MSLRLHEISLGNSRHCLVKNFSYEFREGQTVAITGATGAGKTTLLRLILGLPVNFATTGWIFWQDQPCPLPAKSPKRPQFSYVPQSLCLWPHMSVEQTLRLGFKFSQKPICNNGAKVEQTLADFFLTDLRKLRACDLSGGEKQRLALARALVNESNVLLLDEPFTGLDQAMKLRMIRLIKNHQREQKLTTILVSHQQDEIEMLADETVSISGRSETG
jgi:putative spermidine/putrescine transport system ATP-binding protein